MVDVTSRLRLVVDSSGVDKAGRKLRGLRRRTREADDAARRLQNAFRGLASVVGAAFSLQQLTRVADQYRGIQNQLRLVTGSARELADVQREVLIVANETGASLETTARLYANLERFAGEFLESQQATLDLTRAINQTAVISGASVTEASNAVRQLTQGIAGGILRAEEFNSIVENMPRLAEAIADGLGIGLGELRRRVNDGLIDSQTLISALQSQFDSLNIEFVNSAKTIGQALQGLGNIVTVELGERLQGVQSVAIEAIQFIAQNFESLIPVIEGVGAAVLLLGAAFAAPALVAGVAALATPLGLLAVSIAAVVAFRDDIAEWAFGVRDASAVAQAAYEVLSETVSDVAKSIRIFVKDSAQNMRGLAEFTVDMFGTMIQGARNYIAILNEAFERVRIESLTRKLEELAEQQRALTDQAISLTDTPQPFESLGLVRIQLDQVNDEIARTQEELNKLLNPDARAGLDGLIQNIRDRALEIADARKEAAEAEKTHQKEAEKTVEAVKEISEEAKRAADALARIRQDQIDQQQIIEAARQGERQERIAREILTIRRQISDISLEDARALAEQNVFLDEQLEIIREQRAILERPFDELARNLEEAIVNGGRAGVGGLKDIFFSFLDSLKDAFLLSFFQPLLNSVRNLASNIAVPFLGGAVGAAGIQSTSLIGAGGAQGQGGGALGLGALLNPAALLPLLALGGGAIGGNNIAGLAFAALAAAGGQGLTRALTGLGFFGDVVTGGTENFILGQLGQAGNPLNIGGALVGAIGSSLLFGNSTGTNVGSTLGGVAGNLIPIPGLGPLVGSLVGGFVGSLFGNRTSVRDIDLATGQQTFVQNASNDRFNQRSQQIAQQSIAAIQSLVSALGGQFTAGVGLNVFARRGEAGVSLVDTQTRQVLTDIIRSSGEDIGEIVGDALTLVLDNAVTGVSQENIQLAKDLLSSGLGVEEVIQSLQTITEFTDRFAVEEPLGRYEQALRDINDAFEQAIDAANGVTAAEQRLIEVRDQAIAQLAIEFNNEVQADIDRLLDGPLDQLEQLLRAQDRRAREAEAIGGDLDLVGRLSALELREFFEGLTENALDEVRDFLGLFEEASDTVLRNLDLSRQDLRAQADAFEGFAQTFANLRTQFNERFIAASPRESLDLLRGRASELLGQVRLGNESAAQALPQVLNQLIDNARATFGNTQGFVDVFEFVQQILTDAEAASINIQSEAERQIAALDENNDILADIRDILQRAESTNAFFQSFVSGGVASSEDLLRIIQEGAGLTLSANDNASALNITGLIAQSVQPIIEPVANSIDTFTQRLADMPDLLRIQIEATDNVSVRIGQVGEDLKDGLDRLETLAKKQLSELEDLAA